jgi:hypothetical protein
MITRVSSISELKQIFVETLLNKTTKVTKVSDQSIFNGVSYGVAKIAQKSLKDIALMETHLFPEFAFGSHLDDIANRLGVAPRFGASKSTVYVRVVGSVGTAYVAGTHVFSGAGKNFELLQNVTIGAAGYSYAKLRSIDTGVTSNVEALTLTSINPTPAGHTFCINEYRATGGRDVEQDEFLKRRIKDSGNLASRGTLAYLTQTFQKINTDVLKVYYQGVNASNQTVLAIATQNGIDLTTPELTTLRNRATEYLSLVELSPLGGVANIELKNIEYQPIDISFRVDIQAPAVVDDVRKDLQLSISNYFDYRYWTAGKKIEWDDLLQIVKSHPAVNYVPDANFTPGTDILGDVNKLPRVRGFMMMDLDGNVLVNLTGTLSPLYYPSNPDFAFAQTVLSSI